MKVADMKVLKRTARGSRQVAQLRKEGFVPAVIYGGKSEPVNVRISEWEIEQHIRHHHKVYRLDVEGSREPAFLQDVQFDTLTDRPLHVDFLRIDLRKPITVTVEINYIGHPQGASRGGVLIKDMNHLLVRCLPEAIPEVIEVHVAKIDLGDVIHAGEVELPEGLELEVDPDAVVCHMPGEIAQAGYELAMEEAAAEAEEPAEPEVIGEEEPAEGEAPAEEPEAREQEPEQDKDKKDKGEE